MSLKRVVETKVIPLSGFHKGGLSIKMDNGVVLFLDEANLAIFENENIFDGFLNGDIDKISKDVKSGEVSIFPCGVNPEDTEKREKK